MSLDEKEAFKIWVKALTKISNKYIFISAISSILSTLLIVFHAWLVSDILNQALIHNKQQKDLLNLFVILLVIFFIKSVLTFVSDIFGAFASKNIKYNLRQQLFENLLIRDPEWISNQLSGHIVSSIVDQVSNLENFFSRYIPSLINAILIPISFTIILFYIDNILGILLLLTFPLIPIFMILIGYRTENVNRQQLKSLSRLSGFFADRLKGLYILKLFGREKHEINTVFESSEIVRKSTMKVLKVAFISSAILEFFSSLGIAIVAIYIGFSYLGIFSSYNNFSNFQYGIFSLLIVPEIYNPLRQFAIYYHDKAKARESLIQLHNMFGNIFVKRNINILTNDQNINNDFNKLKPVILKIENLNIHAYNQSNNILDNINLNIQAAQHLAIMGESGSGKTTLLEAIANFKNFSGNIFIDGHSLNSIENNILRSKIYLMGQKPFLFSGSLIDNIKIANIKADSNKILEAACKARVKEFADTLPSGLNTVLGQSGKGISGGQAQRLAIARLFIRNPGLVLLDEPTSHLDEFNQNIILKEIISFCKNRTLIIVTHSYNVAKHFPLIYSLVDGHIKLYESVD